MFTQLLLASTVVSLAFCHPSLYLAKLGDTKDDLIADMEGILEEAEIANRSLTAEEIEQVSRDYSDYCNCNCHVQIGDISHRIRKRQTKGVDYLEEENGDYGLLDWVMGSLCQCNCNPCSGGDADNGGGGGGGCTVSGGGKTGG